MSRFSILVVDDDPVVRKVVARLLEIDGYRATTAASGSEALTRFETDSFDLLITDFKMGEMSGVDLARRLRKVRPEVPICLMTAWKGDIAEEDLALFTAVLEKPFEKAELNRVLAALFPAPHVPGGRIRAAPRIEVDWRVDYIPLDAGSLSGESLSPRRAVLRNFSEKGLSFLTEDGSTNGRYGAFLIYPPGCESPSMMVGEIRWTKEHAGGMLAGIRRLFWGSPRDRDIALGGVA